MKNKKKAVKVNLNKSNLHTKSVIHNVRADSAITLIALVVSIIVLLILAGVSLNLVAGGNGIMSKTENAVEKYSESAKSEKTELQDVEGMMDSYMSDFSSLRSLYGTEVSGYNPPEGTDVTGWKLFYVDEERGEAALISSNTLAAPQPTANGIPVDGGYTLSDFQTKADLKYARNYNSLWLEQCTAETIANNPNAQATAYMCDSKNWTKYVTGSAKYAAGGPTLEMLVASFYDKQINDLSTIITNTNEIGYKKVINSGITSEIKLGLYNNENSTWWLSSPNDSGNNRMRHVYYIDENVGGAYCTNKTVDLRPIVVTPASSIKISGTGESITLSYQ